MQYLIGDTAIFAEIDGKPYSITSDAPAYADIRQSLLDGVPGPYIAELFNKALAIAKFTENKVVVDGGTLTFNGKPVHGIVADRILEFQRVGLPYQPLVFFLQRLMLNPSQRAIKELYTFLERNKMPITEDGFLLGYKGIGGDYKDQWSHTIDNRVGGKVPRMFRNDVDDNHRLDCSNGYHVGSREYATGYGPKTVIVKVDPADVVSVPSGESSWKMRVCYYEVVSDYDGPLPEVAASSETPYKKGNALVEFFKKLFS